MKSRCYMKNRVSMCGVIAIVLACLPLGLWSRAQAETQKLVIGAAFRLPYIQDEEKKEKLKTRLIGLVHYLKNELDDPGLSLNVLTSVEDMEQFEQQKKALGFKYVFEGDFVFQIESQWIMQWKLYELGQDGSYHSIRKDSQPIDINSRDDELRSNAYKIGAAILGKIANLKRRRTIKISCFKCISKKDQLSDLEYRLPEFLHVMLRKHDFEKHGPACETVPGVTYNVKGFNPEDIERYCIKDHKTGDLSLEGRADITIRGMISLVDEDHINIPWMVSLIDSPDAFFVNEDFTMERRQQQKIPDELAKHIKQQWNAVLEELRKSLQTECSLRE